MVVNVVDVGVIFYGYQRSDVRVTFYGWHRSDVGVIF